MDLFKKEEIDFVITPNKSRIWEFAAMAAAKNLESVNAVQFMHGYSPADSNTWKLTENPTDIYLITDREFKQYIINNIFQKSDTITKIDTCSCWLDKKKYKVNKKNNLNGKPHIVFVPTMLKGNKQRYDASFYPDVWYYILHEKLIDLFSELREYTFIYKGVPSSDKAYNPIYDYIKKNESSNVKYSSKNLIDEYKNASKVITDFPSTPMIESLVMDIPTLALYHKSIKIRGTAKRKFKYILQEFDNFDDYKTKILQFLNDEKGKYQYDIFNEKQPTLFEYFTKKYDIFNCFLV